MEKGGNYYFDLNSNEKSENELNSKNKRIRTRFSVHQLEKLEGKLSLNPFSHYYFILVFFRQTHYPDIFLRESIAKEIGLPESRIQVWFQVFIPATR